jgi:two-component system response regulator
MAGQGAVDLLYVEDNPNDAELTLRALKKHGIVTRLHHARDGVEALAFLAGAGGAAGAATGLRLILIDLKLPRVSGLEVLRRVRADERTRTVPVVILTSSSEHSDIEAAYALGVNSYVVKPVDYETFMDIVGRMGRYWLLLNEPAGG